MKRSLNELPEFPIAEVITPNWSTLSEIPSCWFMPTSRAKNLIIFYPKFLSLTFQSHPSFCWNGVETFCLSKLVVTTEICGNLKIERVYFHISAKTQVPWTFLESRKHKNTGPACMCHFYHILHNLNILT